MCDFRLIKKIRLLDGTIVDTNVKSIHPDSIESMKDVEGPGLYSICATGGFYLYYDGKEWLTEYNKEKPEYYRIGNYKVGWEVIAHEDYKWYGMSGSND